MRGGWWPLVLGVVALSSCGLETVESLDPAFSDSYFLDPRLTEKRLFFEHGSQYDGTSFLGYLIYYKIYPNSSTEDFARLLEDRDKLNISPTVNQLVSMGYSSLTRSRSKDSASSSGLDGLLIDSLSAGDEIAVDFTELLEKGDGQPVLQINGSLPSAPYLYRTMALAGTPDQKFAALRTGPARKADMASMTSEQLAAKEYEIAIFVVAYGLDAKLNEVYSKPAPWGIIRKIAPMAS